MTTETGSSAVTVWQFCSPSDIEVKVNYKWRFKNTMQNFSS